MALVSIFLDKSRNKIFTTFTGCSYCGLIFITKLLRFRFCTTSFDLGRPPCFCFHSCHSLTRFLFVHFCSLTLINRFEISFDLFEFWLHSDALHVTFSIKPLFQKVISLLLKVCFCRFDLFDLFGFFLSLLSDFRPSIRSLLL